MSGGLTWAIAAERIVHALIVSHRHAAPNVLFFLSMSDDVTDFNRLAVRHVELFVLLQEFKCDSHNVTRIIS